LAHSSTPSNIHKMLEPKNIKNGSWQRKPDAEIKEIKKELEKSTSNILMPIGAFILSYYTCHAVMPPISHRVLYNILISILMSFITYGYQRFIGKSLASSPSFKICSNCYREDRIGLKKCFCGGVFEPPEFFGFVEKKAHKES
jgi:hypothetical protein